MSGYDVKVAFDAPMQVGEGPLWHPAEGALYWVDIDGLAVHRLVEGTDDSTVRHDSWIMTSEPSALARHADGGLVVATRNGFVHLNTDTGAVTDIAPAPFDCSKARFNDGKPDAAGRFWVGTIYEPRDQPAAEMFVLEKGEVRRAWAGGMTNSNGLAFSPDNRTMYHADTTAHRITRYDFDVATGAVANQREVRQFSMDKSAGYGGRPDGAAIDSEGNYWVAMFEGGRIVKLSSSGEELDEIALPVRCPTMVAFGGADLRTLYITTAGKRPQAELEQYPLSGRVLSVRLPVAGLESPQYRP
ncbi:sugar lactone lactonase YvrE [Pseudoduganella flava]|uniref:SMP-30/gluconolactonase/LRE family protein n=1 Tax=Pseudoduganella flava TaxID=871742 RepID=A0A562PSU8_9BURK|nr:SMP-30/gluconolactonase/LRE family protein [Pseudoduganella flava]QGZ39200.1 SMP-30/gluconolactonase/LRE family protein [Pseudoduganella flava]TWI47505.1 sugar lactone lactonase YvrE [Pseudoduganella flava]